MAYANGLCVGQVAFLLVTFYSPDPIKEAGNTVNDCALADLIKQGYIDTDCKPTNKGEALCKAIMHLKIEAVWTPTILSHQLTTDESLDSAPERGLEIEREL